MIKYIKNSKQFGFDLKFRIIFNSYKPYKLMSIYSLDKTNNNIIIVAFILLKFKDSKSLIKILTSLFKI